MADVQPEACSSGTVDAMDLSDPLTLLLVVLGVLALLGIAVIGFVMWRYRVPPRGLGQGGGATGLGPARRPCRGVWRGVAVLQRTVALVHHGPAQVAVIGAISLQCGGERATASAIPSLQGRVGDTERQEGKP